jgi:argininosuccinate lyase
MARLSRSPDNWFRLAFYDLAGSKAHARELNRAGILTDEELTRALSALEELTRDVLDGAARPIEEDEDVHSFLERVLLARLGDLGGKIRAGRSRNDQSANDLKLFLRDAARRLVASVLDVQDALIGQARQHTTTLAPGFTHLQPAQPIVFAQQLLAHAQALYRDVDRLVDWDRRAALSPLGAAALAGSAIAKRPEEAAAEMGYRGVCENSIDAVGSRDHVAEFLFDAAMLGSDLSRLSEEITLWASRQFGWIKLNDAFSTGSSIMPQKKNPDIAELTRGKASVLLADATGFLATLKGLPLAYNRELGEDKRACLEALDALGKVLPAMAGLLRTMRVQVETMEHQSTEGFTLATEVADWLARHEVPFSEAHTVSGRLVRYCEESGIGLEDLTPEMLGEVDERLNADVLNVLSPRAAVAARDGYGGTAPVRVAEQIDRLSHRLKEQAAWTESYSGPRSEVAAF